MKTARALNQEGITLKRWITREGKPTGGGTFKKTTLHRMLTNVTYLGKVRYGGEIYEGEQPAIIDQEIWDAVQKKLATQSLESGSKAAVKWRPLLQNLLYCEKSGERMIHSYATRKGKPKYRYYRCQKSQRQGCDCPIKQIAAENIENAVWDQIRRIGKSPALIAKVYEEVSNQLEKRKTTLKREIMKTRHEQQKLMHRINQNFPDGLPDDHPLQASIATVEANIEKQTGLMDDLKQVELRQVEVKKALQSFEPVWEGLTPGDRQRLAGCLIESIKFDGAAGELDLNFHGNLPDYLNALTKETRS